MVFVHRYRNIFISFYYTKFFFERNDISNSNWKRNEIKSAAKNNEAQTIIFSTNSTGLTCRSAFSAQAGKRKRCGSFVKRSYTFMDLCQEFFLLSKARQKGCRVLL